MKSGKKLTNIKKEFKHVTDKFEDEQKLSKSMVIDIKPVDVTDNKDDELSVHGGPVIDKSIDREGLLKQQDDSTGRDHENGLWTQDEKKNICEFQAKRDHVLNKAQDDILVDYMELVVQFGYVMFFSSVFPLAGALSMACNYFEMSQAISNLKFKKKFKAEVSVGIGNF